MSGDRNFDDLAKRFQKNIYGGLKGRIRLSVLQKDFTEFFPEVFLPANGRPLRILDAGGGRGPFSLAMARCGHFVTLCDLSEEMLKLAANDIATHGLEDVVSLVHAPIQSLPVNQPAYDLILCHAVIEWVEEPQALLLHLDQLLGSAGLLSLTFYNQNGIVFKNLLRTNYKKIIEQDYSGAQGSLTPTWPREPEQVMQWLMGLDLQVLCRSGMRVFHDYILDKKNSERDPDTVVALELAMSRQAPFRDLGRYQHILARKN